MQYFQWLLVILGTQSETSWDTLTLKSFKTLAYWKLGLFQLAETWLDKNYQIVKYLWDFHSENLIHHQIISGLNS